MTTNTSNRRLFLQGLGGTMLAAPFLGSMLKGSARAQAGADPKRLIVYFTHYGCLTNRWFPAKSDGELTAADYEGTTLRHLKDFAPKLLVPRGMRAMNEWSFGQELGQETDPHTQVMNSYFTCCPSDGWSGLGGKPSNIRGDVPSRKFDARPVGGRSLDHVCAEQVNASQTPLVLAIGGTQTGEMNNFSYRTVGDDSTRAELFSSIGSPSAVYNELTQLFGAGAMDEATYAVSRGKNILDLVRNDLHRVQAANLSQQDKNKLDAWEQLLTETTAMVRAQCGTDVLSTLGTSEAELSGAQPGNVQTVAPVMLNLAVLSALCDHNRVIFMKMPASGNFQFLDGIQGDAHGISHRIGNPNQGDDDCVPGVNEMIAKIDDFYAEQFAYLVGQLDAIEETDGTLLDNTATIWFQELSDGNSHNLNNLPVLQAGSCGGYFKTGVAVNVDDGAADLSPGFSEAACGPDDDGFLSAAEVDGTGTPKELANAPINKYFCNLMNALGVKAGADGFPQAGGSAPVTKFGYYDNTEDFNTFLSNNPAPPTINSPEEFDKLKA